MPFAIAPITFHPEGIEKLGHVCGSGAGVLS